MNALESTKYRKHLEEGGVPPQQAVAHADALGDVLETLVTKDWFRAELHRQLQEFEFDMVKWMVTLFFAQTGITIGAVVAIIRYVPH